MTEPGRRSPRRPAVAPAVLGLAGAGAAGVAAAGAAGGVDRARDRRRTPRPAAAGGRRRRSPSPARTRPASSRRRRTGCTSPPSTSPPTTATSWSRCCRPGPTAARADDRRAGGRSGRRRRRRRTRRRTTPARRSGCPRRGLTLTFGFGPTLFTRRRRHRPLRPGRPPARRRWPTCPTSRATTSTRAQRRRPLRPGLRRRPAGRRARHPQPGPDRLRRGQRPLVAARASAAPRRPAPARRRRATCSASRTAPPTSRPRTPRRSTGSSGWPTATAGADWLAGGSYLVARRIRMHIETWDRTTLRRAGEDDRPHQGRRRAAGPAATEFDPVDFTDAGRRRARRPADLARLPRPPDTTRGRRSCAAATASSTAPTAWAGSTRGCSSSPTSATRGPGSSQVQRNLRTDAMNEYIRHTSSARLRLPARPARRRRLVGPRAVRRLTRRSPGVRPGTDATARAAGARPGRCGSHRGTGSSRRARVQHV